MAKAIADNVRSYKSLEELQAAVTEGVNPKEFKKRAPWYNMNYESKDRFKPQDIVYDAEAGKFGVFIEPAKKEDKVLIAWLKKNSLTETYTRDWYRDMPNLHLVKRGKSVKRGYQETDKGFIKTA